MLFINELANEHPRTLPRKELRVAICISNIVCGILKFIKIKGFKCFGKLADEVDTFG